MACRATASHGQYGEYSSENLGTRLYALGDINGDDFGDVYMAGDTGEARVYHGDASGITGVADQRWGRTDLEVIGDINEDGYDDIRIGEQIKMGSEHRARCVCGRPRRICSRWATSMAMATQTWPWATRAGLPTGVGSGFATATRPTTMWTDSWNPRTVTMRTRRSTQVQWRSSVMASTMIATARRLATRMPMAMAMQPPMAQPWRADDADCDDEGEAGADAPQDDCDDTTALARPGGTEIPGDGVDQDCNGADLCYADLDGDGYRSSSGGTVESVDMDCDDAGEATTDDPATDCNDTNPSISPAATEVPANGQDEDCNGGELCYVDSDDDGYRETTGLTITSVDMDCTDSGEGSASEPATDCDDLDGSQ